MTYELYGSRTSPFVRRLRILLEKVPHEFKEIDIYAEHERINKINPVNQIPVLTDGEQTIWDSRQIFYYLNHKHDFQTMSWDDENNLTAIDGAMSAGVAYFLMRKSGIDVNADLMYVKRQTDRIDSVLNYLKSYVAGEGLKNWDYLTISLYCFVDWATVRKIISLEGRPEYSHFLKTHAEKSIVKSTEIPMELR